MRDSAVSREIEKDTHGGIVSPRQSCERRTRELHVCESDVWLLERVPGKPTNRRPFVLRSVAGRVQPKQPERIAERDMTHLAGGELCEENGSCLDGAAVAGSGGALRGHEHMFALRHL